MREGRRETAPAGWGAEGDGRVPAPTVIPPGRARSSNTVTTFKWRGRGVLRHPRKMAYIFKKV